MFNVSTITPTPSLESLTGRIDFQLQLRNINGQRYSLLDARAGVYLRKPNGQRAYIDQAFLFGVNSYTETARNGEVFVRLMMPMTHANVVLIEELRGNNKVTLMLEVVIMALPLDGTPSGNAPVRSEVISEARIEKSAWVEEFLPAFGMDNYELWEVRFPRLPVPEALRTEGEFLKKALHEYNNGEYPNCYQNCRKVVESLKKRRAELGLDALIHTAEWDRATGFLSIALHVDAELPAKVARREAEFAFQVTRAIFIRVGNALLDAERIRQDAGTLIAKA